MGESYSKHKDDEEVQEEENRIYDKTLISFDNHGNLVLASKPRKPEEELKRILGADDQEEELNKEWCVVASDWVNAWLLYVHTNKGVSPAPGPCSNLGLLQPNEDGTFWIPRSGLVLGDKNKTGDYRRISRESWEIYCELYPGSGPLITTRLTSEEIKELEVKMKQHQTNDSEENKEGTKQPTYDWKIDDTGFKLTNAPKRKLFSFSLSTDDSKSSKSPASPKQAEKKGPVSNESMEDSGLSESQMNSMDSFLGSSNPVFVSVTTKNSEARQPTNAVREAKRRSSDEWLFDKDGGDK